MTGGASDYDHFGPYELHECLGAGGMATVHRASIEVTDGARREVALKRLLPQLADDRGFIDDFIREAKLVAGLEHPNIVKLLELGCVDRTYYIVMELVKGVSLLELLRGAFVAKRPAPIGVTLALLCELCDALDYASSGTDAFGEPLRIVHRDLSPSNLIVTDMGHLKVIDFGVAKAVSGSRFLSNSGLVKGKLSYMAPEVIARGELDPRADLFSAGVVAWEMIAARRLFKADGDLGVIEKVRHGEIAPPSQYNPACPAALDEIVMHALARAPDDRWANAAAMRVALDQLRHELREREPSTAASVTAWKRASTPSRKNTMLGVMRQPTEGTDSGVRLSTDDLVELIDGGAQPSITKRAFRLISPAWAASVRAPTAPPVEIIDDGSKQIEIGVLQDVPQVRHERAESRWMEDPSKQIKITVGETTQDRVAAFDDLTTASAASPFPDDKTDSGN